MRISCIFSSDYRSNSYLAISDDKCFIVDPGMPSEEIIDAINKENVTPCGILLTHGHFDHIFSLDEIREHYSIPVYIHENDDEMLTDSLKNAYSFFFGDDFIQRKADITFKNGDELNVGSEAFTVIHTPGHSKGASCFICGNIMITGDTLFARGIGRSDLHGGNTQVLFKSLSLLKDTPNADNITIYPGHGGPSKLSDAINYSFY